MAGMKALTDSDCTRTHLRVASPNDIHDSEKLRNPVLSGSAILNAAPLYDCVLQPLPWEIGFLGCRFQLCVATSKSSGYCKRVSVQYSHCNLLYSR